MQPSPPSDAQRRAAVAVGVAYLAALPLAVFPELYVRSGLIVDGDITGTAQNIAAHIQLFRLGIASNVAVFAVDVVLIAGLYVALKPVNQGLAIAAAFFRIVETAVSLTVALADLAVLRVLAGGASQSMAAAPIAAHGDAYGIGLVFAGIGSALFSYLWYRSRYIPRPLAAFGLVASVLIAARAFVAIINPDVARVVSVAYYGGPIFVFELTMGIWLLTAGLRPPSPNRAARG